jgi:hypothetical protein
MGDVVHFKKPNAMKKAKGRSLCKSGFHKWQADKDTRFDVKQGKLLTRYVCKRCGKTRMDSH